MSDQKVTVKELSSYCHVSTATISRVINNNGRFSEETRQRVLEAIDRLGYVPNASAKTLRMRTSKLVGIFVNALDYETTSGIIAVMHERLSEHGYTSIICNIGPEAEKEGFYYQMMLSMNVCAIIMMVNRGGERIMHQNSVPVVYVYKYPFPAMEGDKTCIIETDNYGAGYLAGSELMRLGCRRIAEVRLRSADDRVPLGRHLGLIQSLYEHGITYAEELSVVTEINRFADVLEKINTALDNAPAGDGYFCSSDLLALALIRSLELHHYDIPGDVKVIGCNDMSLSMYNNKPITTIRHRIDDICTATISLLDQMLAGETLSADMRRQIFKVDLIQRATT